MTNPIVIVEVLSPGTATDDRGEKLAHYKQIPSLREVVFVAHDQRALEVVRRMPDGSWQQMTTDPVQLDSIGCTLAVADVYFDPLA